MDAIDFSLNKLAVILKDGFGAPDSQFDPEGEWTNRYVLYSVSPDRKVIQGEIVLSHQRKNSECSELTITGRRKGGSGFSQFIHAELLCRNRVVSTPVRWRYTTKMAISFEDEGYMQSELTKTLSVENDELCVTVNGHTRKSMMPPGDYTCKWCLMDAVQRLPQEHFEPIRFTLIDEFDQVRGTQTLVYLGTTFVESLQRNLIAYQATGIGSLPTIYFCNGEKQLLFVVSGLEAYVLSADQSGQKGLGS